MMAPRFFLIRNDQRLEPQLTMSQPTITTMEQPTATSVGAPAVTSLPPEVTLPVMTSSFPAVFSLEDVFVPEMICEEEVSSCDDLTAQVSVRIESSNLSPSSQQRDVEPHFYNPKWSPAMKSNRDQILCDLLGIQK